MGIRNGRVLINGDGSDQMRLMSAMPPIAAINRALREVRFVPRTDIRRVQPRSSLWLTRLDCAGEE
jgi:hypothetical protein